MHAIEPIPGVFDHHHEVKLEEIDALGHVNNLHYLAWAQAAATAHSSAVGWPFSRYTEVGASWVVRSHVIEYLRAARLGDSIVVRTWVTEMGKIHSLRKYQIVRAVDATTLATAQTQWVFVKLASQTIERVPDALRAAFPVITR